MFIHFLSLNVILRRCGAVGVYLTVNVMVGFDLNLEVCFSLFCCTVLVLLTEKTGNLVLEHSIP